jgi:hypothetical protein
MESSAVAHALHVGIDHTLTSCVVPLRSKLALPCANAKALYLGLWSCEQHTGGQAVTDAAQLEGKPRSRPHSKQALLQVKVQHAACASVQRQQGQAVKQSVRHLEVTEPDLRAPWLRTGAC